jgi:hypothetical protein
MDSETDSPLDRLWDEYALAFKNFDDLTLARWMSQTLGQLQGKVWRLSHPLVGAYRLASHHGHERQIWLKRLVNIPMSYVEAPCCRAPLLPLLTRDVLDSGLVCQHCNGTAVPFSEIPADLQSQLKSWALAYDPVHAVAHQEENKRVSEAEYDQQFEIAAKAAEGLLTKVGNVLAPALLEHYPAVVWEDQDECLEVRPEDIVID